MFATLPKIFKLLLWIVLMFLSGGIGVILAFTIGEKADQYYERSVIRARILNKKL